MFTAAKGEFLSFLFCLAVPATKFPLPDFKLLTICAKAAADGDSLDGGCGCLCRDGKFSISSAFSSEFSSLVCSTRCFFTKDSISLSVCAILERN
jgi:hypothetical protein